MRIAIFTESYKPVINGVSTSIDTFATELRKMSHEVVVFAPRYPGYEETDPSVIRVPSYTTPFQRDYPLAYLIAPGLRKRFQACNFDLVHTQAPFAMGRIGMRLARQHGIPLVTTNHTLYTEYAHYAPVIPQTWVRAWLASLMRKYCNRSDLVIAPSESIRLLLESLGVRKPIFVVPTGVKLETRAERDPEFPRKHYGISPDAPLLLYTGRIAREKNMETLVEAFRLVQQEEPAARLLIAGSGPYEADTKALVDSKGLSDKVIFTGFLPHEKVTRCYADSTLFFFASATDTQGLVIAEAMMQGLPPVAVAAYGPTEWVKDGESGFLCRNEPQAMADAALQIIRNPRLRNRMSATAATFAATRSSLHCTELLLDVYQKALGI